MSSVFYCFKFKCNLNVIRALIDINNRQVDTCRLFCLCWRIIISTDKGIEQLKENGFVYFQNENTYKTIQAFK